MARIAQHKKAIYLVLQYLNPFLPCLLRTSCSKHRLGPCADTGVCATIQLHSVIASRIIVHRAGREGRHKISVTTDGEARLRKAQFFSSQKPWIWPLLMAIPKARCTFLQESKIRARPIKDSNAGSKTIGSKWWRILDGPCNC